MLSALAAALVQAGEDPDAELIVLRGAGEHGLSAGHDFAGLQRAAGADPAALRKHRQTTGRLVQQIARHRKPIVAMLRGIVLGAAAGLVAVATHRIAATDVRIALPETSLGQMPDAGLTRHLARAPGGAGMLVGLTGWPLEAADALHLGLVDRIVPAERMDELVTRLANPFAGPIAPILEACKVIQAPGALMRQLGLVDRVFARPGLSAMLAELGRIDDPLARHLLGSLAKRSPLAIAVTHEAIRRARTVRTVEEAINLEYAPVCRLAEAADAAEGIRALLIDRDDRPVWSPANLAGIDAIAVEAMFAPMLPGEAMRLEPPG
jgi:enoyl-CoA hydratase